MICTASVLSILFRQSSDSRPIVWCVIGVFSGLFIFYKGFLLLQQRHLILNTPLSKVRSASLGMVEVNGLAVGPYTMIAPITERPCYYHRTVAWEWRRQGKSKQWVKVAAECMHVPFFLDDNTGRVLVDPRGATLDLHRDFQQEFCDGFLTTKQKTPPNVQNFLLRYGVSTRNKIKVEEFCIKPKNALFVLGTLDENPGLDLSPQPIQEFERFPSKASSFWFSLVSSSSTSSSPSLPGSRADAARPTSLFSKRESEDDRLLHAVMSQSNPGEPAPLRSNQVIPLSAAAAPAASSEMSQQQKVAAALVKAGITNPAAWAAARIAPAPVVRLSDSNGVVTPPAVSTNPNSQVILPGGFEPRPRIVLMKGKNNPNFMISWRSQRDVARSMGWKCTLMIWGGPALTILCIYALHNMKWF